MQQKKFLEVFDGLPTKRKQVLLAILGGDTREKIMADVGVSEDALTQHRRQLYKDFQIEVFQNEADDPRSGERKLPQLIALFAKYKPDLISPNASLTAPAAPVVYDPTWVERPELTTPLLQVLQGECRVLALTGITGIGKTDLAKRLISSLQDGRSLHRLNLDEGSTAAEFSSSGAALLRSIGAEPTLADQQDPQNLLAHLLQLLRTQPYRVQIDSMERLLKGNDREGWSEFEDSLWGDLFQQLLAGNECQSQLVLTTQDLPGELESVGSRYPQVWHCQSIRGLGAAEQLELFAKRGLPLNDRTTDYLRRMGKLYAGHPLVLRVIAEDIKEDCGGDVRRYWQQGRFEELEANRPADLSQRKLQLQVKRQVKAALERLPTDALQLLQGSAVYRRPVPESFWLVMLADRSQPQQQAALNLLKSRALAEEDWEPGAWLGADEAIPLRQHNLIRSVAYELLKADEAVWKEAERKAAEQWLNSYEAVSEAPNLEKVRGYLEAFEHYLEVKDYQTAIKIPYHSLKTKNSIQKQLLIWGHFRELVPLHRKLLFVACKVGDREGEGRALGNLGIAFNSLGSYAQAIEFHQKSLAIAREISDRRGEGNALGNLGNAYDSLGNYAQAIEFHQKSLVIARETGDRQGEGRALGNLGITYDSLGNYFQAIEFHQQRLAIAHEIGDRRGESKALGNLGVTYNSLGNYSQAIEYAQQHLNIAREIGDRRGEGAGLRELGAALIKLEQHSEAFKNLQNALGIFREVSNPNDEAEALKDLVELYQKLGETDRALEYCDRALAIAIELGIPLVKECETLKQQL